MIFGQRLKHLRRKKSLTVRQLSETLQISASTLTNYEQDYYQPDLETLLKMADFFNVSIDYFLGRTDIPTIKQSVSSLKHEYFVKSLDPKTIKILNNFKNLLNRIYNKK